MRNTEDGGGASRSTDPAAGTSSATDVSLREYVETLIRGVEERAQARNSALEEKVQAAFESSQTAISKADVATEKRFEGVNEFRAALSDQASHFVTREALAALADKLESQLVQYRRDIEQITKRLDLREGQTQGTRLTTGILVTVTTVAVGVLGLVVVIANYLGSH
jgi:hypothetical protein